MYFWDSHLNFHIIYYFMKSICFFLILLISVVCFTANPGTSQNAPVSVITSDTVCQNSLISVPLKVSGFNSIAAVSLRIEYDTMIMKYNAPATVFHPLLPGAIIGTTPVSANSSTYKIMITWVSFSPASLPDGATLVSLGFKFKSGNGNIVFNNTTNQGQDCEYADEAGEPLNDAPTGSYYINGQVLQRVNGGAVNGTKSITIGQNTGLLMLSGYQGTILKWQVQHDGSGYTDIPGTAGMTAYSEYPGSTGTWNFRAVVQYSGCQAQYSIPATITVAPGKACYLTTFIEGLFDPDQGEMKKVQDCTDGENTYDKFSGTITDTLSVFLANALEPWNVVYECHHLFLNSNGQVTAMTPQSLTGSYYIVIRHRQGIETWSNQPVDFSGSSVSYDFTASDTRAFGNNLKQLSGSPALFGIYSGDVRSMSTQQDGYIDIFDNNAVFNESQGGAYGYLPEDLTGDGFVDVFDMVVSFNNVQLGKGMITPPNPGK